MDRTTKTKSMFLNLFLINASKNLNFLFFLTRAEKLEEKLEKLESRKLYIFQFCYIFQSTKR